MRYLLAVSRWIDTGTRLIGQWVAWLIVVAAVISAGNAIVRKLFDISSNAWLEMQWWLFAAVFLLAAPWTLALNEHIRIDIVNERFPRGCASSSKSSGTCSSCCRWQPSSPTPRGISSSGRICRASDRRTPAACRSGR